MTRVFDFDETIFDGDSTARYCAFSLKKRPALLLKVPVVALSFLMMAMGLRSKTRAKQTLYKALLSGYEGTERDVREFWDENFSRIKGWYQEIASRGDIVISASPEFLLRIPCEKLGARLVASRVDQRTGQYSGLNCHGAEKVRRYREENLPEPFEFYSDSKSDEPMARLAQRAYIVDGDEVREWGARP